MLRKIVLHGRLATDYTPEIEIDADDLRMVVAGLESNYNGFLNDFVEGEWHILRGDLDKDDCMTSDQITMLFGTDNTEIHIFPKIEGAGGKNGVWTAVLGIAIIAFAWWAAPAGAGLGGVAWGAEAAMGISYGQIAMFGVSMALSGVSAMMAPTPSVGDFMSAERAQDKPSFMFNGPVNVMVAGGPVPLVYGEYEVGSTVVSAGIVVEKLPV